MASVLISGGTGMVGKKLTRLLTDNGYHVVILTRNLPRSPSSVPKVSYARWDIRRGTIDQDAIASADYIINLAGAGLAEKRWTDDRKKEIIDSRTQTAALLVKALSEIPNQVKAVLSASASGFYGRDSNPPKPFTEHAPPATDFLASTCKLWEGAIAPVRVMDKRLVIFRIGIVLSKDGGALAAFCKPLRMGIAAILGNGRQIISWIHIDDLCRMFLHAMKQEELSGIYNAAAPVPVSNKTLMLHLAKARGRFYIPLPVPAFLLKIVMGEMAAEVLKSTTMDTGKIQSTGFGFDYPDIKRAADNLM
jgi:uncharacterized protein (TIGR01777 family)